MQPHAGKNMYSGLVSTSLHCTHLNEKTRLEFYGNNPVRLSSWCEEVNSANLLFLLTQPARHSAHNCIDQCN